MTMNVINTRWTMYCPCEGSWSVLDDDADPTTDNAIACTECPCWHIVQRLDDIRRVVEVRTAESLDEIRAVLEAQGVPLLRTECPACFEANTLVDPQVAADDVPKLAMQCPACGAFLLGVRIVDDLLVQRPPTERERLAMVKAMMIDMLGGVFADEITRATRGGTS